MHLPALSATGAAAAPVTHGASEAGKGACWWHRGKACSLGFVIFPLP
jgi:hypothetical protein